jgi:hypothetical protein
MELFHLVAVCLVQYACAAPMDVEGKIMLTFLWAPV